MTILFTKVATMSRTVCSWCKAPLVLKDDILVCSNTDCPACDEKYLHEALIRTRKALEIIKKEFHKETMPDFAVIRDALKIAEQKEVK